MSHTDKSTEQTGVQGIGAKRPRILSVWFMIIMALLLLPFWVVDWNWWSGFGYSLVQKRIFLAGCLILFIIGVLYRRGLVPAKVKTAVQQLIRPPLNWPEQIILIFLFSCAIVFGLYGSSLRGNWWVIDDHELINFMGKNGQLAWKDFIPTLLQTEVGHPGSSSRFRPVYYFFRLLGSAVLGNHPLYWYAYQLVILLLFLCVLWYLVLPYLGLIPGGLFIFFVMSGLYWPDIFSRIGGGEVYTVLGVAFFAFGFDKIVRSSLKGLIHHFGWFLILLGTVIASGSKENMVILIIPLLILFFLCIHRRAANWWVFLSFSTSIVWLVFISVVVITVVSRSGNDIYLNSTSLASRFNLLGAGFISPRGLSLLIPLIISAGLWGLTGSKKEETKLSTLFKNLTLALFALFFLYLSQYVFYSGQWPVNNRFDFPGMLYFPLFLLEMYIFGLNVARELSGEVQFPALGQFLLPFILLVLIAMNKDAYSYTRFKIEQQIDQSNAFSNQVSELSQLLKSNPATVMIIQSGVPLDYEPIFSYTRFLRVNGVNNPIYVRWSGPSADTYSNIFSQQLVKNIQELSLGKEDLYSPLSEFNPAMESCITLHLNGQPLDPCRQFEAVIPR